MSKSCKVVLGLVAVVCAAGLCGCGAVARVTGIATGHFRMASAARTPAAPAEGSVGGDAAASEKVSAPKFEPDGTQRVMVYNALMHLVVENVEETIQRVKSIAFSLGGYLQERDARRVIVKVPVGKFEEAMSQVGRLGEVTRREGQGTDVTEEMRDLRIRLGNAEEMRKRILSLLERVEKVEDALKLEKELARVTETIELLKGKIRYLESRGTYARLEVCVNAPVVQKHVGSEIPFRWVNGIAEEVTMGSPREYARSKWFGGKIRVKLPKDYVKYYQEEYLTRAMSGDSIFIKIARHDNYEGGTDEFWAKLARRVLVARRVLPVKEQKDLSLKSRNSARVLFGTRTVGHKTYGYAVAVAAAKRYVYVYEAWGPEEAFDKDRQRIEDSIQTLAAR